LITGASGRLGTAFCRLAAAKYQIVAVSRRRHPECASQRQTYFDPLHPHLRMPEDEQPVYSIRADLTDERELERVVELTLARFDRIDLLVNAAAFWVFAPLTNQETLVAMADQFLLNTLVPMKLASAVWRQFWRDHYQENLQANRNVINVSSISATHVFPGIGQGIYSATKAALNQLSLHMASEFGSAGIRVNAIAPTSFPSLVPAEAVVEQLIRCDEGRGSGEIVSVAEPPLSQELLGKPV
jgi:NAD(P)-dependent dehydrogenase (short-subunit alcohol dehydrogenase family)